MMNTAEAEPDPFVSAVKPEMDNVIPFPMPEPPSRELSFNEILMSLHAGQPYFAFFRPDYDKIAELKKQQPDYHFTWGCSVCGAHPTDASMMMLGAQSSMCDTCLNSISKLFPIR